VISANQYKKSSFSASSDCVEVRLLTDGTVGLRDSKDVEKGPHVFSRAEWTAFVAGVRAGEFDLPAECV
jgi:hypothetical protein